MDMATKLGVRRRRLQRKKTSLGNPAPGGHQFLPDTHDGPVDDDEETGPLVPRPPVTRREYFSALRWWQEEYCCALACIIGSTLLGLLLRRYDNQLVPDLPFGNFDMAIVFMMTVVRVALKAIVEASISQGAWIWVSEARQRRGRSHARLEDFKLFDDASRGLWGSIALLWRLRLPHLGCIGAAIVVLVHGFETFSQQMYVYEQRPTPYVNETMRPAQAPHRSEKWDLYVRRGISDEFFPALSTKAAIYSGILASTMYDSVSVDCGTANCTWPTIPTLAVCGECVPSNVSISCVDSSKTCSYTTASNTTLVMPQDTTANVFKVAASEGHHHRINTTDQAYISAFDIVTLTQKKSGSKAVGNECALWFCLKSYSVDITDGKLHQEVLDIWNKTTFEDGNSAHPDEYLFVDVPKSMNVKPQSRYSVSGNALMALRGFINSLTDGMFETQFDIVNYSSDWIEVMWNATTDLPTWINRLSVSLTNEVREAGTVRDIRDREYDDRAAIMSTYIRVQWLWLLYPAILILASIHYLFHTIIEAARDRTSVWKSDSLPMLFCRIDATILGRLKDGMDVLNGLEERVGKVKVALQREEDGDWTFKPLDSDDEEPWYL